MLSLVAAFSLVLRYSSFCSCCPALSLLTTNSNACNHLTVEWMTTCSFGRSRLLAAFASTIPVRKILRNSLSLACEVSIRNYRPDFTGRVDNSVCVDFVELRRMTSYYGSERRESLTRTLDRCDDCRWDCTGPEPRDGSNR